MFNLFKKKERTPKQQAERAQMGILARLGGCAYLVYLMIQMLKNSPKDGQHATLVTVSAVVMLALSVVVIAITIYDFFRGLKEGRYKTSTYESAESDLQLPESGDDADDAMDDDSDDDGPDEEYDPEEEPPQADAGETDAL